MDLQAEISYRMKYQSLLSELNKLQSEVLESSLNEPQIDSIMRAISQIHLAVLGLSQLKNEHESKTK